MQITDTPEVLTLAEFAARIRRDLSWVYRLRDRGRLAMDGDRVRVAESLALIEATAGSRPDVTDRNAERRAEGEGDESAISVHRRARADAELRIKRAEADRAELARDREAGELIAREEVGFAMRDIGAFVRATLEMFPDQAAPLIAERLASDRVDDIHELLQRECHIALGRIAEKLRQPQPGDERPTR